MSQENVEIVRRFAVAMDGDLASIEAAVAELFEEDSDYYPVRKFPDARPSHGREEFADWMKFFYEGFPRLDLEIRELFPVGDDRVLAWMNLRAEGRGGRDRPLGRPLHVLLDAPGPLLSRGGPSDLARRLSARSGLREKPSKPSGCRSRTSHADS